MRNYCWEVKFELGSRVEIVYAGHKAEAIILAQAKQIEKGNRYDDVESACKLD